MSVLISYDVFSCVGDSHKFQDLSGFLDCCMNCTSSEARSIFVNVLQVLDSTIEIDLLA